jgi:hypothetical protein
LGSFVYKGEKIMTSEKLTLGAAIDQVVEALKTLEKKEQQTVISTVCTFLDLNPVGFASASSMTTPPLTPSTSAKPEGVHKHDEHVHRSTIDIRTLKDQKQPDSARQMACVVAYYLLDHAPEAERKNSIKSDDLEKYFKQAGYKLPKKIEQVLVDCKAAGYFETISRGEYKLTRVGYNLVTHSMPKGQKG